MSLIPCKPKTQNQADYLKSINSNVITFASGPAGCGKTFLAIYAGILSRQRLVFVRPVVDAGEQIGFIKGSVAEKLDPYMQPFYDSINQITTDKIKYIIAPLAFMKGRTFINDFIIFDEAQNSTPDQMKMFLSRLGKGCKMVITGDPDQSDLPINPNGFTDAWDLHQGINKIGFVKLTNLDIQRHFLVKEILARYDHRRTANN